MQMVGEKPSISLATTIINAAPGAVTCHDDTGEIVSKCVFENLACRADPGITGVSFYTQTTRTEY